MFALSLNKTFDLTIPEGLQPKSSHHIPCATKGSERILIRFTRSSGTRRTQPTTGIWRVIYCLRGAHLIMENPTLLDASSTSSTTQRHTRRYPALPRLLQTHARPMRHARRQDQGRADTPSFDRMALPVSLQCDLMTVAFVDLFVWRAAVEGEDPI